jgi:hypothetical protein
LAGLYFSHQEPCDGATQKTGEIGGSSLTHSCHVCAFFHTQKEKYQVLMPFIKEGFEKGDRALHIVNASHRSEHIKRLLARRRKAASPPPSPACWRLSGNLRWQRECRSPCENKPGQPGPGRGLECISDQAALPVGSCGV